MNSRAFGLSRPWKLRLCGAAAKCFIQICRGKPTHACVLFNMLYPQESESREVKDLSGIWNFKVDPRGTGQRDTWFAAPLVEPISMPVPASYNDITQDAAIRDHIGDVWYERTFFVPGGWTGKRVCLRFASAEHTAVVWVNGVE